MEKQTKKLTEVVDTKPLAKGMSAWFPAETRRQMWIGASLAIFGCIGIAWEVAALRRELRPGDLGAYLALRVDRLPGERLTEQDLAVVELSARASHPKAVPTSARDLIVGRQLRDGVAAGETLLWNVFASDLAAEAQLSALVRKGERAVAIQVDGISAVGYFVSPGDRVDLFLATRLQGGNAIVPVLQNVSILATGHALAGQAVPESYGRVVVSVTPHEAELLLLAQQAGKIHLLLRHVDDVEAEADFPVLRESEFLGTDLRKNVQERRNERVVRIVRGAG